MPLLLTFCPKGGLERESVLSSIPTHWKTEITTGNALNRGSHGQGLEDRLGPPGQLLLGTGVGLEIAMGY